MHLTVLFPSSPSYFTGYFESTTPPPVDSIGSALAYRWISFEGTSDVGSSPDVTERITGALESRWIRSRGGGTRGGWGRCKGVYDDYFLFYLLRDLCFSARTRCFSCCTAPLFPSHPPIMIMFTNKPFADVSEDYQICQNGWSSLVLNRTTSKLDRILNKLGQHFEKLTNVADKLDVSFFSR